MTITALTVNDFSGLELFSDLTFGRDIARFQQLVEFLTIVSIALWACVALTAALSGIYYAWHRRRQRRVELGGRDGHT